MMQVRLLRQKVQLPIFVYRFLWLKQACSQNFSEIERRGKDIFFVHGIHNIAPVIAGSLLGKKVYWFILETPSNLLIIIFKIFKLFFRQ